VPLLVGLDGHEKMSKSLGNAIAVEDPAKEIYGKTMSVPDSLMWDWLLLLTDLSPAEIAAKKSAVAAGTLHPKAVKQELARTLVAQYHGAQAAQESETEFERSSPPAARRTRCRSRVAAGARSPSCAPRSARERGAAAFERAPAIDGGRATRARRPAAPHWTGSGRTPPTVLS
jgi:hypothetical protein